MIQLPNEILPFYINYDENHPDVLKKPHITASLSIGAKASKTKDLEFVKYYVLYHIKGVFGY